MSTFKILWKQFRDFRRWDEMQYATPAPQHVKRAVILRNGICGGTWVETGTHLGDTAEMLATVADHVHTIEPAGDLFRQAKGRLANLTNVTVHHGTSEDTLGRVLRTVKGNVTFWLDGHYSAGMTFKGKVDTPIVEELAIIGRHIQEFRSVAVLIDDIRCFNPKLDEFADYPPKEFLVSWFVERGFDWHIEHDIFVAKKSF